MCKSETPEGISRNQITAFAFAFAVWKLAGAASPSAVCM